MWWIFIKSLVTYFKKLMPDVSVAAGREEGWPTDFPAIRVLRGGEPSLDILARGKGLVTIWIDCWCENNDLDPGVAYEMLADLESRMNDALKQWMKTSSNLLKVRMVFDDLAISSDRDVYRPRVGSRTVLKISWNK